jgi:hypothetical protein
MFQDKLMTQGKIIVSTVVKMVLAYSATTKNAKLLLITSVLWSIVNLTGQSIHLNATNVELIRDYLKINNLNLWRLGLKCHQSMNVKCSCNLTSLNNSQIKNNRNLKKECLYLIQKRQRILQNKKNREILQAKGTRVHK